MDRQQMLEKMDPELRALYEGMSPYSFARKDVPLFRKGSLAAYRALPPALENYPGLSLQELGVPGGPGNEALGLRIFAPREQEGAVPVILYVHGGGCIFSCAEEDDPRCMELASDYGCVVVNVDYRLAPDFPAPAGQLDCCAAWEWICTEGAKSLNLDLDRSAFMGGSAGGNMVLGAALRLLDGGKRLPKALLPLYPMIDDRNVTASSHEITDLSVWGRAHNVAAWEYYINGLEGKNAGEPSGYTAPSRRESFAGLPPVFTFIGDLDLFRDEVLEMVCRMTRDGVPVEFSLFPGCFHGFDRFLPKSDISRRAIRNLDDYLTRTFAKSQPVTGLSLDT